MHAAWQSRVGRIVVRMENKSLAVILPAFNEENSLVSCTERLINVLQNHVDEYQVIIINDGSADNTSFIARMLEQKYSNVNVIDNNTNLGIGRSYKNALSYIKCKYVTWLPTDGEIDPIELVKTLSSLNRYHCIGTYPVNSFEIRSPFRHYLSLIYQWLFRILFVSDVKYFNGVTLFRTSYVKELKIKSDGFTFTGESVIKFLSTYQHMDNVFTQVGIKLAPRQSGSATAIKISVLIDVIWFIITTKIHYRSRIKLNQIYIKL